MLALIPQHYYKSNFLSNRVGKLQKEEQRSNRRYSSPIHILYLVFQTILIPLEELLYTILDFDLVSPSKAVELIY